MLKTLITNMRSTSYAGSIKLFKIALQVQCKMYDNFNYKNVIIL